MTRQYNRRETATQTPGDAESEKTTESPETVASDDNAETGDVKDDSTDDTSGSEKTDTVKAKKTKTRAQLAREDANKVREAQDKATLEGAPTFEVTYPTGHSRYLPGEEEIEVTMSGGSKVWVDVINGFALIPLGGRMRARSADELMRFTRLAGQSALKLAPPD